MMTDTAVIEISRDRNPFAQDGVARDDSGTLHYIDVPATLIDVLRDRATTRLDDEAVVELGGRRRGSGSGHPAARRRALRRRHGEPGVVDAAVIPVPDEVMSEKVGAVLVSESGDLDPVLQHCRKNLADFKIPQFAQVSSEALPRNAGGKLLKNRLRGEVEWGDPLR